MIYHTEHFRPHLVPLFCILILGSAAVWSAVAPIPVSPEFDTALGRAKIEGVVIRDPDRREKSTQLVVAVEKLNGGLIYQDVRALVFVDRFADISYGDRIIANGILKHPEAFETDAGRIFNYRHYLLAHGITYQMSFARVTRLEAEQGNAIVASLISLKHVFLSGINTALPEPASALLAGLLIGDKQSLGEEITSAFRNAGVVHIIVLSGYNVALVISAVTFLLLYVLPRAWAYGAAAVFVIAFAVMTGLSETTVRAVIMALFMMLATVLHRPAAALRGLFIAAAAMALWNPYVVLYDLSFQLSVLATAGLILFSDSVEKRITFVPRAFGIREIFATTLSTQAVVLPLLIFSVGQVSLVFLPANIFVLPAVPFAMLFGFLSGLVALVSPALAFPLSALAYGLLSYIIHVALWLGALPFASVTVPQAWTWPALTVLLFSYGVVFLYYKRKNPLG